MFGLMAIVIIVLIIAAFVVIRRAVSDDEDTNASDLNKEQPSPVDRNCNDGTISGQCSETKPVYCDNGTLINKCSVCGCPSGKTCNMETEQCKSKTAVGPARKCKTLEGLQGVTGRRAVENVLFKWNFEEIDYNTCDTASDDFFFCDPTQFSISLAHRLEKTRELASNDQIEEASALTEFESLLIADNYSEDFQKDFAHFYSSRFFETPSWFGSQGANPWSKYFSEPERLVFSPRNLTAEGSGVYKVKIVFDFEGEEFKFFDGGEPAARITIELSKIGSFEGPDSVFYHLPLNGLVGTTRTDEDGVVERKDYGVGFMEGQPLLVFEEKDGRIIDSSARKGTRTFTVVKLENFNETNLTSGLVAFIAEPENIITFAPSYALVVVAGTQFRDRTGNLFYRILENGEELGENKAHLAYWTTIGPLKAGEGFYTGEPLELGPDARADTTETCLAVKTEEGEAFGLHWENVQSGQKAMFESFFFTPLNKTVILENACSEEPMIFATENDIISRLHQGLGLTNSSKKISYFYELLDLIKRGEICVVEDDGHNYFYWDRSVFRRQEEKAIALVKNELVGSETKPSLYPNAFQQSFNETISLNKLFSYDYSYSLDIDKPIYGLSITGKATLNSDDSLVRVILVDTDGKEYLVYEAYPLISEKGDLDIKDLCEETCALNRVMPSSLKIQVTSASIELSSISYSSDSHRISPMLMPMGVNAYNQQLKTQQANFKIKRLNEEIKRQGLKWIAGETPVSSLSYEEKKRLVMKTSASDDLPNLHGFEYYKGGVFEIKSQTTKMSAADSSIPGNWDWRERHGANNPESPYYNGFNGWLTPIKHQGGCGSCWAFAATGAVEAAANLYFNSHLNLDFSEQDIVSCSGYGDCKRGAQYNQALGYYRRTGVVSEECFPYKAQRVECNKCGNWQNNVVKIGGYNGHSSEKAIKEALIREGPAATHVPWAPENYLHAMTLIGWETDPEDGKTVWIFKNSWGTGYGEKGYVRMKIPLDKVSTVKTPITLASNQPQIKCIDFDQDGYCNWGISKEMPDTCPETCKPEKDCDDSNPGLGPFDEKYDCMPLTTETHKECVNGVCVEVAGAGEDECQENADCGQPTHKECVDGSCVSVQGAGADQCQQDSECKPQTHKVCSNGLCITVDGEGEDECNTDEQCITTGTIKVRSSPRSRVFLDGVDKGMTPMLGDWGVIEEVPAGEHTVKFTREGYQEYTRTFELQAGKTKHIEKTLTPMEQEQE